MINGKQETFYQGISCLHPPPCDWRDGENLVVLRLRSDWSGASTRHHHWQHGWSPITSADLQSPPPPPPLLAATCPEFQH